MKLTTKARNALPSSDFAIPSERKYPMEDASHVANAKARVAQFGSPAEKAAVDRKATKRHRAITDAMSQMHKK